jgi:hypothetical protein
MVCTGAPYGSSETIARKIIRVMRVRRSVTLPPKIVKQVETLARERDLSDNRVLVALIEQGIEARPAERKSILSVGRALPRRQ